MMKTTRLLLYLFLLPVCSFAQGLSGLYTGNLTNDSNTVRKDQSYELALSEYKGRVTGYSYSNFIVNDTLYYIVKRVKGIIDGNVCEVKDDYVLSTNFGDRLDKGVKQVNTFRMSESDSLWHLEGEWKTNRTKKFYALSGSVAMQQEKDFTKSKLLEHLGDLNLDNSLSFYKPQKKVYYQEEENKPAEKPETPTVKTEEKKKAKVATATGPAQTEITGTDRKKKKGESMQKSMDVAKVDVKKDEPKRTSDPIPEKKSVPVTQAPVVVPPAAKIAERKQETIQTVFVKTDSLRLALYDNGEVDGDTVTVLLNGEILMAKQGLKSSAIKQTIYFNENTDTLEIVLYAENLGKYPPNTGLLTVYDGEQRYEIRFSADFQKSAAVVFKRKKP
jgi:hypothetical protein